MTMAGCGPATVGAWAQHAYAIRDKQSDVADAQLIAFARERLAGYKVPRTIEFVAEFPHSPTGTVLTCELRSAYIGSQPER
jgi:acyl-CoA synthetase (AMP-forming)/AMP-acid ligase II